jgi:plasmid maintenance system antidote protein VapI
LQLNERGVTIEKIAEKYNVHKETIKRILNGIFWRRITKNY